MSAAAVEARTHLGPEAAWRAVTEWSAHARHVPFTTIEVEGAPGIGQRFVATTRIGPLVLVDPMVVTAWTVPTAGRAGHCEVRKEGDLLRGGAELDVRADGPTTTVRWLERVEAGPDWLATATAPISAVSSRVLFGRVLRSLLRDAEAASVVRARHD